MRFENIKLNKNLAKGIRQLGWETMSPIQEKSIKKISSGRDLVGIAPTGSGKTAAYLIPLINKLQYAQGEHPRLMIMVPTKDLVFQVREVIEQLTQFSNLRITSVYGGSGKQRMMDELERGTDILIATPGRVHELAVTRFLVLKDLKYLVVDEADSMLEKEFFRQVEAILELLPEQRQNVFFSATFDQESDEMSQKICWDPIKVEISEEQRPVDTLSQYVMYPFNKPTKLNLLSGILWDYEKFTKVIVFAGSKKDADAITSKLGATIPGEVRVIHSNKDETYRLRSIEEFRSGEARVLVATGVAARGIDVEDVSHVINFNTPYTYTDYVHKVGRTARNGAEGTAITFVGDAEKNHFESIEENLGEELEIIPLPDNLLIIEESDKPKNDQRYGNTMKNSNRRRSRHEREQKEKGAATHEKSAKNSKEFNLKPRQKWSARKGFKENANKMVRKKD
ncbi:DEAD/DEAH box helicase [Persicobacter psychrovividus]|uniref:DEAD/DEAH box helicase n=1 Tax=Persicobacter psychrovividus TaxID=387638 RepID=A0ABM7VEC3_9BACT|nr:DEAD/DEAH box helicase [Persicobacter psychrovividus]